MRSSLTAPSPHLAHRLAHYRWSGATQGHPHDAVRLLLPGSPPTARRRPLHSHVGAWQLVEPWQPGPGYEEKLGMGSQLNSPLTCCLANQLGSSASWGEEAEHRIDKSRSTAVELIKISCCPLTPSPTKSDSPLLSCFGRRGRTTTGPRAATSHPALESDAKLPICLSSLLHAGEIIGLGPSASNNPACPCPRWTITGLASCTLPGRMDTDTICLTPDPCPAELCA